ncbi:hypothetical protein JH146_1294 [Methanocaldococcus bathoardescens]|uniref:DOD-type homing endonuclease domain-containing protein n=1 Tax=Methanocaldococcus bathoardescens TaxID=1301915 RepID=A0A076LD68_9EURY|nr:helix-turn-helix domain-containing protein [Methanocaldococcus bathoardescens]AIJ06136.1 hypothetical protein JH146_1294 [Methanocaldococcus bathoardescens]
MKRKVTDEIANKIVELYNKGWSIYKIANYFNIDRKTVRRYLKKHGIEIKNKQCRKVTNEMIIKWIKLYKDGLTVRQIATMYNIGYETVRKWLIKSGINMRKGKVTDETAEKWVKLYKNGWSIVRIAKEYNVNDETVRYWLKKKDVKLLNSGYRSKQRALERFKKVNLNPSESLAYILGVIEGDGCISKNRIKLYVTDKDFADEFERHLKIIGFDNIKRCIIKKPGRKEAYEVYVFSAPFCEWYRKLEKYKDYEKMFNSEKLMGLFLRGVFDSEGSVSSSIRMTNTNKDLIDLCCKFLDKLKIEFSIYHEKRENYKDSWTIRIKKKSLIDFKDKIRFNIKRKQEKLEMLCK